MRTLGGIAVALLAVGTLAAQNRTGFVGTPGVTRSFGSVIYPGGTSAMPGIQRTTPSVIYPGGGGPQIGIPAPNVNTGFRGFGQPFGGGGARRNPGYGYRSGGSVFAYPVIVGGYPYPYYDTSYLSDSSAYAYPQQQQQQPNITVILPPQQPPVIINQFGQPQSQPSQSPGLYQPQVETAPEQPEPAPAASLEPAHYLLAFKDHTIYSAVAYWIDGETLHYFTSGNTHNQVSLSLVDRELTERLNRESGLEVKFPPARQ